jgi:hypothetical protein
VTWKNEIVGGPNIIHTSIVTGIAGCYDTAATVGRTVYSKYLRPALIPVLKMH